ncbi:mRNA cleavage and polyadenylation factor IA/II complex [Pseudovirgaria hyperparasitica]|uniref:Polynucleotide 5'-hydroxyl-kinase GRC3 n=1 Tax=Pseudovirgaria hyperparasitica TaxID=470096 RepID=A0A6A6W1C2_9PEZI|nr:mRNA cleavage and polyadenylation factor IA/II complex [Pseudovirgaria hyperparasitica]KAF2755377.1 mRNA cleavage and polyadenylation factor IA/II complex [Pseudovirgaria hyperparasitica]
MSAIPGLSLPGLSLPGLGLSSTPISATQQPPGTSTAPSRYEELPAQSEYRFEVGFNQTLRIKLTSGTAELFGTELPVSTKDYYVFTGTKAAIYTWHGCRLELQGDTEVEYVSEETQMLAYANVHFGLENEREKIANTGSHNITSDTDLGPRVLIVGPSNAGKTSLVKTLTAYAVKSGRQPMVVNLDTHQGMLSVPGSISTAVFTSILDVEEGWGSSPISGPSPVPVKMPLVYHLGLASPDDAGTIFRPLITRMALAVTSRLTEDASARVAGCIIDTPGSIAAGKAGHYDAIAHIISEFSVNVVLVLGSERLYSDLNRRYAKASEDPVSIIKLDKSGGCVDRDEAFMKTLRATQIRAYFFGHNSLNTLSPHTHWVEFGALHIYRIITSDNTQRNTSFLPGDDDDFPSLGGNAADKIYEKVAPSMMMQNCLLAVTSAQPNDSHENIRNSSVLGYLYVADVEEAKKRVRLLAPISGRLPGNALVFGNWPEDVADLVG